MRRCTWTAWLKCPRIMRFVARNPGLMDVLGLEHHLLQNTMPRPLTPFHFVDRSYMPPCPSFYSPQKSHGHKPDRIIRFNLLLIYLMAWGKGHGHMRGFQGSQERKKKPYYVMPVTSCRVRQLLRERGHEDGHDPLSISGVFFFYFAICKTALVFRFNCTFVSDF